MIDKKQKSDQELPPIPDYPDAPLPAWKHYGITNYASQKIIEELDRIKYKGYMVGLEVAYSLEDEQTYSMSFGTIDVPRKKKSDADIPLTDEFLVSLYQVINDLIPANAPEYSGRMGTELTIAITGSKTVIKIMCRVPDQCTQHHTGKRWCKKVNNGPWTCLHTKCR